MSDILMPALSPTMEEGGLAKWHVKPGDKVEPGQVIAEIETDKATMEVEAVDDGEISEILVPEGTQGVKVNTPIARMKEGLTRAVRRSRRSLKRPRRKLPKAAAAPAPKPAPSATGIRSRAACSEGLERRGRACVRLAPGAPHRAAERRRSEGASKGSGPHGRIVKRDVEGAPKAPRRPTAGAARGEPRQVSSLEQMGIAPGSYDLVPLDGTCAAPSPSG